MKKRMQEVRIELCILQLQTNALETTVTRDLLFHLRIFDEVLQLSSSLRFAKAELYLIGGCQDEWFELTYYIETLVLYPEILNKTKDWALVIKATLVIEIKLPLA